MDNITPPLQDLSKAPTGGQLSPGPWRMDVTLENFDWDETTQYSDFVIDNFQFFSLRENQLLRDELRILRR